jgi:hypothetical protein
MQRCQLRRLPPVGSIDYMTPECVILEMVATHGCQVVVSDMTTSSDRMTHLIRTLHATILIDVDIHPHLTPNNLPLLARFVNAERHTWTVKTLFMAYDHLNLFIRGSPVLPQIPWISGPKTPDHPLSYDACMLYSLCKYHQIRTTRRTTLQQMTRAIENLLGDPTAKAIETTLQRLLELSMYMRGWKVSPLAQTNYPIQVKETGFEPEAQGQVFLNVTCAIRDFETQIDSLIPPLRDQLSRLPLLRVVQLESGYRHDYTGTQDISGSPNKYDLSFRELRIKSIMV